MKRVFLMVLAFVNLTTAYFNYGMVGRQTDGLTIYQEIQTIDPELARELAKQDQEQKLAAAKLDQKMGRLAEIASYIHLKRTWLIGLDDMQKWLPPAFGLLAGYYSYVRPRNLPSGFGKKIDAMLNVGPLNKSQKITSAVVTGVILYALGEFALRRGEQNQLKRLEASSDEEVMAEFKRLLCETNTDAKIFHFPSLANESLRQLTCR